MNIAQIYLLVSEKEKEEQTKFWNHRKYLQCNVLHDLNLR